MGTHTDWDCRTVIGSASSSMSMASISTKIGQGPA
jgi:hypothetical protein